MIALRKKSKDSETKINLKKWLPSWGLKKDMVYILEEIPVAFDDSSILRK